eukprot:5446154-Amphidinium_carterae.1
MAELDGKVDVQHRYQWARGCGVWYKMRTLRHRQRSISWTRRGISRPRVLPRRPPPARGPGRPRIRPFGTHLSSLQWHCHQDQIPRSKSNFSFFVWSFKKLAVAVLDWMRGHADARARFKW